MILILCSFRIQLFGSLCVYKMSCIPSFNLWISGFAKTQRNDRLSTLTILLFHTPPLVKAKGWL